MENDQINPATEQDTSEPQPMLLQCPIDGEEYWSDKGCPRAAIHEKIIQRL